MNIKKLIARAVIKAAPPELLRDVRAASGKLGPEDVLEVLAREHAFPLPMASVGEMHRMSAFVDVMMQDKYPRFAPLTAAEFDALKERTQKVMAHYHSLVRPRDV